MALTQVSSDGIKNLNVKTADLENSGVTAGTYGSASLIPALVIDAKGRVTSASTNSISTDLVNDTSPQLGGNLDVNTKNIVFGNSSGANDDRLVFGSGTNFLLFFDGSAGAVQVTDSSAKLRLGGSTVEVVDEANADVMAKFISDGAVELYHDNIKTFETISGGAKLQGGEGLAAHLYMFADEGDDNADKWVFRADASSSQLKLRNYAGGSWEESIIANGNGNVELYHDNSKKFETTSSGVTVSGNIDIGGNDFNIADSGQIHLGDGADLRIYHSSNENIIKSTSTGDFKIKTDTTINITKGSSEDIAKFIPDGAVELYYDNSKKLETESSGARTYGDHNVTGEIHLTTDNQSLKIGAGADLRIKHDGTHNYVNFVNGALIFQNNGTSVAYFHNNDGHFLPWTNNTFDLGSSGNRWRNIYTNDLNLSNEGGANDIDGTWGSFTIQEGAKDLFLINKRNGKKYKFNLTEVL